MLTLFHAPKSRGTRILWLLEELGADYDIRYVSISRGDGSGAPDPHNPHPRKQVPTLLHDGTLVTESVAVALYLTDLFPDSELGRPQGHRERGAYLSWLAYYAGVIEPAMQLKFENSIATVPHHAKFYTAMCEHVIGTLTRQPFLVGETVSSADIILGGTLLWMRDILPESVIIDQYVETLSARPALKSAWMKDAGPQGE